MMRPQEDIQITGGRVVRVESAISPYGRYYVVCDKHPALFHNEIYFNFLDLRREQVSELILDTAKEALRNCPWCTADRNEKAAYKKTRFPEGAEL